LGKEESDELEPIDPKDAFTHSGLKAPQNTPAAGATGADDDAVQQFILSLPKPVQKRVRALQNVNEKRAELHKKFLDERRAIELKYQAQYLPLYAKRADIVNGRTEPTAEEVGPDAPALVASGEGGEAVSGIPHFWLKAMQNNDEVAEAITEADEKILEHLEDIQSVLLLESKGFMLTFKFSENEHFANTELTKKYVMVDEEEPTLDNAEGTEIQWKPGKNVTVKIMRKKQKHKSGKGSRTITKEEPCDSFFNFFAPTKLPENDEEMDEEEEENLQNLLEADYELGCAIKDQLIPNAVNWFTGAAVDDDDYMDDDEDDDDEDFDDDDDEDDEDEPRKGGKGGKRNQGRAGGKGKPMPPSGTDSTKPADGAGKDGQQECKQQ